MRQITSSCCKLQNGKRCAGTIPCKRKHVCTNYSLDIRVIRGTPAAAKKTSTAPSTCYCSAATLNRYVSCIHMSTDSAAEDPRVCSNYSGHAGLTNCWLYEQPLFETLNTWLSSVQTLKHSVSLMERRHSAVSMVPANSPTLLLMAANTTYSVAFKAGSTSVPLS